MGYLDLAKRVLAETKRAHAGEADSRSPDTSVEDGQIASVKLVGTVIGDVWLARDEEAARALYSGGIPVFLFGEVEALRGKTADELRAIADIKRVFPGSRVIG